MDLQGEPDADFALDPHQIENTKEDDLKNAKNNCHPEG